MTLTYPAVAPTPAVIIARIRCQNAGAVGANILTNHKGPSVDERGHHYRNLTVYRNVRDVTLTYSIISKAEMPTAAQVAFQNDRDVGANILSLQTWRLVTFASDQD